MGYFADCVPSPGADIELRDKKTTYIKRASPGAASSPLWAAQKASTRAVWPAIPGRTPANAAAQRGTNTSSCTRASPSEGRPARALGGGGGVGIEPLEPAREGGGACVKLGWWREGPYDPHGAGVIQGRNLE